KAAWKENSQPKSLQPVFQKLFEDAKEVRTLFFQNLGGASYGSLARRLLPQKENVSEGPILVIGAGKLARAIFPYFTDRKLVVWNRTREKIPAHLSGIDSLEELDRAWMEAEHVLICIPSNPTHSEFEDRGLALWEEGKKNG